MYVLNFDIPLINSNWCMVWAWTFCSKISSTLKEKKKILNEQRHQKTKTNMNVREVKYQRQLPSITYDAETTPQGKYALE